MLNPAQTCENRGITRIWEQPNDIVQPPKTGCSKQFAGKMRAKNPGKSSIWCVQDRAI